MFQFIQTFIDNIREEEKKKQEELNNYVSSFDDEIVKKSSFLPLKRGGTNIKSHDLIVDNNGNYLFKAKLFFPLIFLIMFSIPFLASIIIFIEDLFVLGFNIDFIDYISQIIFSLIFITPAVFIFYLFFRSYIFDFQSGYFYDTRYKKRLYELLNNEKYKNKIIKIDEIHALQIISELVSGKNSSFMSYELNMILKDSSRVNITDHGNLEEIRKDAKELSSKLGVKVYDLTNLL